MLNKNNISLDHIKPHNILHSATEDLISNHIDPTFYDGQLQNAIVNSSLDDINRIK